MAKANKVRQAGSFSMEWVKDPKNQPIVAAIAIAVIIGVGIFYYFNFIKPPAADDTAAQVEATAPVAPGAPGATAPPVPGAPPPGPAGAPAPAPAVAPTAAAPAAAPVAAAPASPAAGKGVQMASVTPMETWRGDPFQPIGYKAASIKRVRAPIRDFPFMTLPGVYFDKDVVKEKPEIQQPPRRMAGVLLNHRVFAIIESNGGSEVVQPGDYLKDKLAVVQRIEPDKVILRTVDEKPRYITVRMAASAHQNTPTPTTTSPGGAMIPRGPNTMRRGAPMPPMAPGLGAPP